MSRIQWHQRQVSIFLNRRTIEFNSCSIFFFSYLNFFQNHQCTLTWCFLSCFLCRNLFLFVAVFTLTLPRKKKLCNLFHDGSFMRKFGFPRQFMHKDYACLLTFSFFVELTFTFVFSVFMWLILLFQSARTMCLLYISSHSVKKFHTWFETGSFYFSA